MTTYIVKCVSSIDETVVADKGYVDNNGNLRFYNMNEKHSVAQFASGQWKMYKRETPSTNVS